MKVEFFILVLSITTRLFYIYLAYASSQYFGSYDKSTQLVTKEKLSFLLRWDAIYFYEIIKNGYSREHLMAFFPAYPYIIRYISNVFNATHLVSGVVVSNVLFVLNTLLLYRLTCRRYKREIAYSTVMFFVLNPGSIIHSSLYSESLYIFLFLIGFYFLEKNYKILSVIFFALTTATRSNGVLNALLLFDRRKPIQSIIYMSQIVLPFIVYQHYCYQTLGLKGFKVPYDYIQKKYWNLGFLKFYTGENIPNIIIGLPFVMFVVYCLISFVQSKLAMKKKYFTNPCNQNTVVLMILLGIQTFMCLFMVHMQIIFRFISYNPLFYWFLSFMYEKNGGFFKVVCFGYFYYGIAYAILFGAYFPPA